MAIAGDQRDPELVGSIWKDDTKKNCRCTISSVRVHETVSKEKYIVYSVPWFAPNTKLMIGSYPPFHQYVRKIKCRQVLFYKPITAVEFFQLLLEFVWDINMIPTVLFLSKDIWRMAISMCKMKGKQSQDVSSVALTIVICYNPTLTGCCWLYSISNTHLRIYVDFLPLIQHRRARR